MNINRHNYETWFLMYADNELPAAEKILVEEFVTANPDLKEELQMLLEAVMIPDDTVFEEKALLLKPALPDEATEAQLLLLLDNELPANERALLLERIRQEKNIEEEWQLLQQLKLSPSENIVFEDKESLYRKEERRVVPMRWWQMAAAAIFLGFGLWGTVSYLNTSNGNQPSVETAVQPNQPAADKNNTVTPGNNAGSFDAVPGNNTAVISNQKEAGNLAEAQKKQPVSNDLNNNSHPENIAVVPATQTAVQQQPAETAFNSAKTETAASSDIFNNNESNISASNNVTPVSSQPAADNTEASSKSQPAPADNYASNVSAGGSEETTYSTFDEDDEDKPKRTKVGGFFKRVKRVFERKTKIKTGNSEEVKIANMAFAMH